MLTWAVVSIAELVFEIRGALRRKSGTRGEIGIAQNAEDPCFEIGARLERRESAQGLQKCLLHQILRVSRVAAQPYRHVVERRKQGHNQRLKRRGLSDAPVHRALPWQQRHPGSNYNRFCEFLS
jgi:hypothetical protein